MRFSNGLYSQSLSNWDQEIDRGIGGSVSMGGAQGGGGSWVFGQSIDFTLATPGGGYNIEGGYLIGDNGKQGKEFVSQGVAFGLEASMGWNVIIIKPNSNFNFGDLEGMGDSWTLNIGIFSLSAFGNSSPGYPENSVFDSYKGLKIGIGAGIGGDTAPNSNTKFQNWIPEGLKNIDWDNIHWH